MSRAGNLLATRSASLVVPGDRTRSGGWAVAGLGVAALCAALFSVAVGPTGFIPLRSLAVIASALTGDVADHRDALVVLQIRLPRALLAVLIGAALASAGCVMQGLFRNPLADPGLIGTSSGAALAAVALIVLGGPAVAAMPEPLRLLALPIAAFAGALTATAILYAIATRDGRTSIATMLLAGIAIAALASAFIGLLVFVSDDRQLRDLTFWTLGSVGGATWGKVAVLAPFVAAALAVFCWRASALDAMLLGEREALHLGVETETLKRLLIVAVAGAAGAAVGMSGIIGFIGLVVPHLLRLLIGPMHRALIPATALGGAALLAVADTACRIVVAPAELPIGILTALFGAPFFLWLLLVRRGWADR